VQAFDGQLDCMLSRRSISLFQTRCSALNKGSSVPWTVLEWRQGSRGVANVKVAFWRCAHQISTEEVPH